MRVVTLIVVHTEINNFKLDACGTVSRFCTAEASIIVSRCPRPLRQEHGDEEQHEAPQSLEMFCFVHYFLFYLYINIESCKPTA